MKIDNFFFKVFPGEEVKRNGRDYAVLDPRCVSLKTKFIYFKGNLIFKAQKPELIQNKRKICFIKDNRTGMI